MRFRNPGRPAQPCLLLLSIVACLLLANHLVAADWPAWRHDAARSAVTTEALPVDLQLQWTRSLGPNHIAWGEDPRLQFDASYEPIVTDGKLIVASASDHSVTAYATETGQQLWRYLLSTPVRLAPFAHDGRVYFGADDSKLYCLDASSGTKQWVVDAAPSNRLVIGNERLISVWAARGGVVIVNDHAYYTVGVWPFEGCLLCKVNIDGTKPTIQTQLLNNVSPQGHLSAVGDRILVPGGRGLVSCFDAETLSPIRLSYTSGRGTTESHVASSDNVFFHGDAIYDFEIQQQLDIRLIRPVADGRTVYGVRSKAATKPAVGKVHELVAYNLNDRQKITSEDRRGKPVVTYKVPELSTMPIPDFANAPTETPRLILKAANHLLGTWGQHVFAIDVSTNQLLWQRQLPEGGKPSSLIVADGKLFAVTTTGHLHCLAAAAAVPEISERKTTPLVNDKAWSDSVADLLKSQESRHGHCVVLGSGTGGLISELLRQSDLTIHVIEPDVQLANKTRRQLDAWGVHGSRATVIESLSKKTTLPPYMASLIVSEDAARFGKPADVAKRFYHVLRPYGGKMVLNTLEATAASEIRGALTKIQSGAEVTIAAQQVTINKVGAIPGAADWTHEYGDPSNTLMSEDQLVKAPFGVLWFGGPASHGELFYNRHFWGPGLTVSEGRMIVQGPKVLACIDIYTGELLWKKEVRDGSGPGRRGTFFERGKPGYHFAVTGDAVYLVYEDVCLVIDPVTGETRTELRMPVAGDLWGKIRIFNDTLIVAVFRQTETEDLLPKAVRGLNRHTGEILWTKDALRSFPLIAVGGDSVYCFDGYLPGFYDAWKRKGLTPGSEGIRSLRAFDIHTGDEQWTRTSDRVATWMAYSPEHDVLVVSNKEGFDAMGGEDGGELWKKVNAAPGFGGHPENVWDKVIISGDKIIDQRGPGKSYDLKTGKPIVHLNPISFEEEEWAFTKTGHHCNYAIASPHLLTFRAGTAGFFDRESNTTGRLDGFRSGCRNSLIPAGGVLNAPNYAHGCNCNYNLFTSLALVHLPSADLWTYSAYGSPKETVAQIGINVGAAGDRVGDDGTLWLEYPPAGDPSPKVTIVATGSAKPYRLHSTQISGEDRWIGGSGAEGLSSLKITVGTLTNQSSYNVTLYFAEPQHDAVGQRVFDVLLQGKVVVKDLDPFSAAGGARRVVTKVINNVQAQNGTLTVDLKSSVGTTLLSGVQLVLAK
jgi:outer membrane protein assembly factor BamB